MAPRSLQPAGRNLHCLLLAWGLRGRLAREQKGAWIRAQRHERRTARSQKPPWQDRTAELLGYLVRALPVGDAGLRQVAAAVRSAGPAGRGNLNGRHSRASAQPALK